MSENGPRTATLTRKDFQTDQEVRWCPGCGDYAILKQVQTVLAELGRPREKIVFVAGIGCSSRFPYYVNTYGFHGIHGRAPAIATGIKCTNPELSVWVITGDGDGLSIGGNHLLHVMRRNVDVNILLFNNEIYGLTKGQYSPTSPFGKQTKSSPMGNIDRPVNPVRFALAAEATFVARTLDVDQQHLAYVLKRAAAHRGVAFVEILQNCHVFNDGAFREVADRALRDEHRLMLAHGKPMLFGRDRRRGIRLRGFEPEVVDVGEGGVPVEEILVHDEVKAPRALSYLLTEMKLPAFPMAFGVFRCVRRPTYDELLQGQVEEAVRERGPGRLEDLFRGPVTWEVK